MLQSYGYEYLFALANLEAAGLIYQRPAVNIYATSSIRDELPLESVTGEDENPPEPDEPLENEDEDEDEGEGETGT